MLAAEVLLDEQRVHRRGGVHAERDKSHLGHLLHHYGVVDGVVGVLAPGERTMVLHEHTGGVDGVDVATLDAVYNHHTGLFLILGHLTLGHITGAGNGIVEIVGMGGADVGNVLACLCPCRGIGGVGVHNAAQLGEGAVENEVGGGVRRWVEVAFYHLPGLQIYNYHIGGLHHIIVYSGGLDDHKTFLAVDA